MPLLLDDAGFIYKWPLSQSRRLLWTDVDHFALRRSRRFITEDFSELTSSNVVFDYAPRESTLRGKWTTAISGRNLGLLDMIINAGSRLTRLCD